MLPSFDNSRRKCRETILGTDRLEHVVKLRLRICGLGEEKIEDYARNDETKEHWRSKKYGSGDTYNSYRLTIDWRSLGVSSFRECAHAGGVRRPAARPAAVVSGRLIGFVHA